MSTRKWGKKLFLSTEYNKENEQEIQEVSEHNYASQPKLNVEELYVKHHLLSIQCSTTAGSTTDVLGDSTNSNNPMNKVKEIISSGVITLRDFVEKVLMIPDVREAFWSKLFYGFES